MEGRSTATPPLVGFTVAPRTQQDRERLIAVLDGLAAIDPALSFAIDPETATITVSVRSEAHMKAALDALREGDTITFDAGAPRVAYRETISSPATIDYTHRKLTGGSGEFARVMIAFEPLERGAGFVFENAASEGSVPARFIPGIEKGLSHQKNSGLLAGFPLIDFRARLIDGAFHDMDSSEQTFQIAARAALRELAHRGDPRLLEPIMKIEVVTPDDYLDAVIADLHARRGQAQDQVARGDGLIVTALVPLAHLWGYADDLASMTQGGASFDLAFAAYAELPPDMFAPDDDPRFPPAAGARAVHLGLA